MASVDNAAKEKLLAERRASVSADSKPRVTDVPLIDLQPKPGEGKEESPKATYRPGMLVKPLTGFYETIGGLVILGDQMCGQAIIDSAEEAAKSLDELARTNPRVRRVLMRIIEGSAITKVVVAHLPILMVVLAHHFPNALKYLGTIITGGMAQPENA